MTDREKLEKLKKLADAMYYAAQNLTTDASRLHKAMEEYHKFIIHEYKEEPSEDLGKEIENFLDYSNLLAPIREVEFIACYFANWQKEQFAKNRLKHCNSITNEQAELEQGFIDQHLDKYQRMPTYLDAIEYGMRLQKTKDEKILRDFFNARNQGDASYKDLLAFKEGVETGRKEMKEQMMKDALDAVVKIDAGGYPYVDTTIELYDYDKDIPLAKEGDKYKVILIKED